MWNNYFEERTQQRPGAAPAPTPATPPPQHCPACGQRLDACVCAMNVKELQDYVAPRHEAVKTPDQHYSESLRADLHTKPPSRAPSPAKSAPRRAPSPASRARFEAASVELNHELRGAAAEIERIRTPPKRPSPQGSVTSEASRQKKTRKPPLPRRLDGRIVGARASPVRRPASPAPVARVPVPRPAAPVPLRPVRTWDHSAWAAAVLVVLITLSLHYAPAYRSVVDQYVGISREGGDASALLYLLPLVLLIVYDAAHNPLHRFFPFPDRWANYVLRVAGGYGIVQVLAQDLGLKTGAFQRDVVQQEGVQFLLLWGGAFAVTGHRSEGLVAALLYFVLKHHVSAGETSSVCFEGV